MWYNLFNEHKLLNISEFDNLTNYFSNFDYGRNQVRIIGIIAFLLAIIGHIICGVTDCLLGYSKKGRLNLKDINDADKMSEMFKDMPLSFPLSSMLLGTLAITMFSFGYFELCNWIIEFSETASVIMFISAVIFLIPIVTHHVFCGVVAWMYIRLGRTNEAREAVLEFQKKTFPTMYVGYAGLLTFVVTLFIMISSITLLPHSLIAAEKIRSPWKLRSSLPMVRSILMEYSVDSRRKKVVLQVTISKVW